MISTAYPKKNSAVFAGFLCIMVSLCGAQQNDLFMDSLAADSTMTTTPRETDSAGAAIPAAGRRKEPGKIKVVKRRLRHREQIALALFMMGFAALAMTTAQSWNPR